MSIMYYITRIQCFIFKCFTVGRLSHEVCKIEASVHASMSIRHANNTLHTSCFFTCINGYTMLKRESLFNLSPIPFVSQCSLLHNMFVTICYGLQFKIQKISSVGQPFKLHRVSVMKVQSVIFSHTYNVLLAAE